MISILDIARPPQEVHKHVENIVLGTVFLIVPGETGQQPVWLAPELGSCVIRTIPTVASTRSVSPGGVQDFPEVLRYVSEDFISDNFPSRVNTIKSFGETLLQS